MPLFGNKFSPKKPAPRKAISLSSLKSLDPSTLKQELGVDNVLKDKIRVNLGNNKIVFDGTEWVSEGANDSGVSQKELNNIKKQNSKLQEENNLLKLKVEVLLDMVAKSTAEQHLQTKEIDDLKSMVRSRSSFKQR